MDKMKFYIKGSETDTKPVNYEQLQVRLDWTAERGVFIEFDRLRWRDTANSSDASGIIAERSGGQGFGVGIPFNIKVSDSAGNLTDRDWETQ